MKLSKRIRRAWDGFMSNCECELGFFCDDCHEKSMNRIHEARQKDREERWNNLSEEEKQKEREFTEYCYRYARDVDKQVVC